MMIWRLAACPLPLHFLMSQRVVVLYDGEKVIQSINFCYECLNWDIQSFDIF